MVLVACRVILATKVLYLGQEMAEVDRLRTVQLYVMVPVSYAISAVL